MQVNIFPFLSCFNHDHLSCRWQKMQPKLRNLKDRANFGVSWTKDPVSLFSSQGFFLGIVSPLSPAFTRGSKMASELQNDIPWVKSSGWEGWSPVPLSVTLVTSTWLMDPGTRWSQHKGNVIWWLARPYHILSACDCVKGGVYSRTQKPLEWVLRGWNKYPPHIILWNSKWVPLKATFVSRSSKIGFRIFLRHQEGRRTAYGHMSSKILIFMLVYFLPRPQSSYVFRSLLRGQSWVVYWSFSGLWLSYLIPVFSICVDSYE